MIQRPGHPPHVPALPCTQITHPTTLTWFLPATSVLSSLPLLPTSAPRLPTLVPLLSIPPSPLPTRPTHSWPSAKHPQSLCLARPTHRVYYSSKHQPPTALLPSHYNTVAAVRATPQNQGPLLPTQALPIGAPCLPQYSAAVAADASPSWE